MVVYKLSSSIDGTRPLVKYFRKYENAYRYMITKIPQLFDMDGRLMIEGCSDTIVEKGSDPLFIFIHAIPVAERLRDIMDIKYGDICIETVDLPQTETNMIYELHHKLGEKSDLKHIRVPLEISGSSNHIRKLARSRYKSIPRIWNIVEFDKKINEYFLLDDADDFLKILKYKLD